MENQSEKGRTIYVPFGVLPTEKPELALDFDSSSVNLSSPNKYEGVRIPLNWYLSLLRVNEIADESENIHFSVIGTGISRLVREYGVEEANKILKGLGTAEQQQFLEKLIKLERIRVAVAIAIKNVLSLRKMKSAATSPLVQARDSEGYRDSILQRVGKFETNTNTLIEFPGSGRRPFGDALFHALPKSKRTALPLTPQNRSALAIEERYPLTEASLAVHTIENGDIWMVHHGGDIVDLGSGVRMSINECLREAVAGIEGENNILERWKVESALDGYSFFPNKTNREPPVADPYYLTCTTSGKLDPCITETLIESSTTDGIVSDESSEEGFDNATIIKPVRVPANPWSHGWLPRNMVSPSSRGVHGQALAVMRKVVIPIVRRYIKYAKMDPKANASLRAGLGYRYGNVRDWAAPPERERADDPQLLPVEFEMRDINDSLRGICQAVGEDAMRRLQNESKKK